MTMAEPDESGGGGASILTRKTGPLPNWVWMALLLLVALAYSIWQRNKSANVVEEGPPEPDYVPGDQTPPPVFILPQNPQPTVPVNVEVNVPPHSPVTPPSAPPVATKPPVTKPVPKPAPPPKPTFSYTAVKVAKYTSKNPPWNSTLWGMAKQYGWGSAGDNWKTIWNDPKNAGLRSKRKDPRKIQPGDTVYVRRR